MKKYLLILKRKYKDSKIRKLFFFIIGNAVRLVIFALLLVYIFNKNIILNTFSYYYNRYINTKILQNSSFCKTVVIDGVNYSNYKLLQEKINIFCNDNNYRIDQLKDEILKDPWIKELNIQRLNLNTLKITITEYTPFALWFENPSTIHLIDQFGNTININRGEFIIFQDLLVVKGENFKEEINSFFNLLSIHHDIAIDLKQIERIGKRRWNLILKGNILVKMPEEDKEIFKTWIILDNILKNKGLKIDLLEIDLRVKDKIFLKYKNQTVQELRNL